MTGWTRVAAAGEVAEDRALRVEVEGTPVCLARSGGQFYAVNDLCTHADVSLSEGEIDDGLIECWLHGSQFDLATGKPVGLPATIAVATYAVRVVGDDVLVSLEEEK